MKQRRAAWRTALQAASAAVLCLCLQACPQAPEKPEASALHSGIAKGMHRNALMDAAFGAAQQQVFPQEVFWQASLPLPHLQIAGHAASANNSASAQPKQETQQTQQTQQAPEQAQEQQGDNIRDVLVRPREVIKINETQLALVIESLPQSAAQQMQTPAAPAEPAPLHTSAPAPAAQAQATQASPTPVWLGVIFFSRIAAADERDDKAKPGTEAWRATRVIPFFDAMLLEPQPPETQVYKLGSDHYLMTYMQHACRQGTCSHWLTGYLLRPNSMVEAIKTRLSGNNVQAWSDCHTRLQPYQRSTMQPESRPSSHSSATAIKQTPAAQKATTLPAPANTPAEPAHICYAINGELHPISRKVGIADVSIRFEGAISEKATQRRTLAQTQLWRLQGSKLVQIEGEDNPVPSPELLP